MEGAEDASAAEAAVAAAGGYPLEIQGGTQKHPQLGTGERGHQPPEHRDQYVEVDDTTSVGNQWPYGKTAYRCSIAYLPGNRGTRDQSGRN